MSDPLKSFIISFISFRTSKDSLFPKPVPGHELFLAVSYSKPALREIFGTSQKCDWKNKLPMTLSLLSLILGNKHFCSNTHSHYRRNFKILSKK